MNDRTSPLPRFHEGSEGDGETYTALSGLAVAALVFGLLSATALIDPLAWLVPLIGLILGVTALVRIMRSDGELTGRRAALAGLFLSIFFGSIAVGNSATYRHLLQGEARKVGMAWFERMARRQPQLAYQLALNPDARQPFGEDSWAPYRESRKLHGELEKHLSEKLPRVLLALGESATVRYYATESIDVTGGDETVVMLFVVTFDADDGRTSFLVRIAARRVRTELEGRLPWRILGIEGGVRPAWEEQPEHLRD
jgi:hypothetical protein